jgi:AcrR family transcriptional regulator
MLDSCIKYFQYLRNSEKGQVARRAMGAAPRTARSRLSGDNEAMTDDHGPSGLSRRRVGRPRVLTRAQVIETAARMPPGEVTMTRLAETLGVSIGTLYQYVADRDELIRLLTEKRMGDLPLPADTGQHWSDYLREYVRRLSSALAADGELLINGLSEPTMEPELRFTEAFYTVLVSRGFDLDEAVQVQAQVSIIAVGAALGDLRQRVAVRESGSVGAALGQVLAGIGDDELPLVRRAARAFELRGSSVSGLVEAMIASIASRRGEQP